MICNLSFLLSCYGLNFVGYQLDTLIEFVAVIRDHLDGTPRKVKFCIQMKPLPYWFAGNGNIQIMDIPFCKL